MNRRRFVSLGAVAGVAAVARPVLGNELSVGSEEASAPRSTVRAAFELEEVSVAELREGMERGKWSARQITDLYLQRIEDVDRGGPKLNAVIEVNPDARRIADSLDAERKSGKVRGPMHGIPVLIKDNIDTADQMRTSAGSLALAESTPPRDSEIVRRMRAAGMIILGKTNLSEWANFRSSNSTSGWSGRGRQTHNPWSLDRNPCGSSSGSGAGVSANLSAVAVGTETDGSIVCPSHANGVVGIKPTVGLVSRAGIVPISHSQDTAGPMARSVADAAALLSVLAGSDSRDKATAASSGHVRPDYTTFLDPDALSGARIGVARAFFGFDRHVDAVMDESLEALRRAGAELVDPLETPTSNEFGDAEFQVLLYEFKAGINAYLESLGSDAPAKSLADLIAFNEKNRDSEMPYFGQELFVQAEKKGPLTEKEYIDALAKSHRLTREEGIDALVKEHRLDAIVAPTGGPAWVTDLVNGDHFSGGSSSMAAAAGYPNINVPAGYVMGLPIGISFFGPAWSEPRLIALAYSFEQATKVRKAPPLAATLDLR
jgi:amidase